MTDPRPVGSAMWGGRPWPEGPATEPEPPTEPAPDDYPATVGVRDLVSLTLTGAGWASSTAGAAVLWGPGAGFLTGGVLAMAVGVLIGATT